MLYLVTGCAGFIGSQFVDRLLAQGHHVRGIDNFSTGIEAFLNNALVSPHFSLMRLDLLAEKAALQAAMENIDVVVHFAANADVRFGLQHPQKDLEQNVLVTCNILEAMRVQNIKRIVFASTGSVYGEANTIPTPENAPFLQQTSLYAASKLAAEGFIQAYAEGFNIEAYIFRFVSILGERYTHGHVFDFYQQLLAHPNQLSVLGNGKQRKSYLYIQDCLDAIQCALMHAKDKVNIFNLGTPAYCEVNDSIRWICDYLKLTPQITYSGGERGWVGDNPFIFLDCKKIEKLGWTPKHTIEESVKKTIHYLQAHRDLLITRQTSDAILKEKSIA